jgi:hypothetical protein
VEWKFEEQFMMAQWDKWMRWILERKGSLPRDCFENFLEEVIDLKAKHDKLAELVSEYIEIVDAGLPTDTPMLNARQALRKYLKEAALRKAVE